MKYITFPKYPLLLAEFVKSTVDVLLPHACISCNKTLSSLEESGIFCEECLQKLVFIKEPYCSICGKPFLSPGENHTCGDCILQKPPFILARSIVGYGEVIASGITRFKYGKNIGVGESLATMFARHNFGGFTPENFDFILPVPLHKNRLLERGFNQSLILAKAFAKKNNIPMDCNSLIRHIDTKPQASLEKKDREKNILNAFSLRDTKKITGKSVIIIDDVYTTGSTIKECSKILYAGGVQAVVALTLSRA